jgi:hypothetical protein
LSRDSRNILRKDGLSAVANDVVLKDLETKPALAVNLLQYTPPNLMLNLIDGANIRAGDVLYGIWKRAA